MSDSIKAEKKAFSSLIVKTVAVLALLTGINTIFIVNAVGLDVFEPLKRNLASAQEKSPEKAAMQDFSPVVSLDCRRPMARVIDTGASSARFLMNHCQNLKTIINKTNGNRGDLFEMDRDSITTDFILLSEGSNKIEILLETRTEVIVINREKAKKTQPSKAL